MPSRSDIDVWRGNTLSVVFQLNRDAQGTPLPLSGSTFVFRVLDGETELLRKASPSDELSVPTPSDGKVLLSLAPADTRALPLGMLARYELERRVSSEETTVAFGFLNVAGGVNDDA